MRCLTNPVRMLWWVALLSMLLAGTGLDAMSARHVGAAPCTGETDKGSHLEVEGLRLILKEIEAQLVCQQHVLLHDHPRSTASRWLVSLA